MNKWMDIETAPKDGNSIICVAFCAGEPIIAVAHWSSAGKAFVTKIKGTSMDVYCHPTHWMPMPEPPQPDMV